MKFFDLRPWNILSMYDLEDFKQVSNKSTPSKRSKSATKPKGPKSPVVFRKSLPKRIDNCSHLLTPTKSSLQKIVKPQKKLQKSKSTAELKSKPIPKKKQSHEEDYFAKFYKNLDSPLHSPPIQSKKLANPKNLEIDTDQIELEHTSPDNHIQLDTINYYSTPFTVKEAICEDLLTGKIFSSSKLIRAADLLRVQNPEVKLSKRLIESSTVEIQLPDEGLTDDQDKFEYWENIVENFCINLEKQRKLLILTMKKYQKPKKKVKKVGFCRNSRNLEDISKKIGQLITEKLQKRENTLQILLEKVDQIKPIHVYFPPQYHQCQDFIVELLLLTWEFNVKPLTAQKISVILETDKIISDLSKFKDPTLRLGQLLSLIPLLIVSTRYSEASSYIKQAFSISSHSKIVGLWMAWLEILTTKNTASLYYSLSESHPPANLSIQYKLALVYSFYYSCIYMRNSRTLAFIKTLELGEWESLILSDIFIRSSDKASEDSALNLLKTIFESSPNFCIKFLSFFRLFHIYKSYNQHSRALNLVKSAEKINFPDNFKILVDMCMLKIYAKLKTELVLTSEIPLLKYEYCRLSLKHNLRSPLGQLLKCINESCAYAQNYSLTSCQFPVNFWKFILYNKLKIHKLAVKQAQVTLDLGPGEPVKHLAINELLKNLNQLQVQIESLKSLVHNKDKLLLYKCSESIEKLDPFLAACIRTILSKSFQYKEKIPIHKFEGHFAIWSVLYSGSKYKEKQFKPLSGQEEIDKRDKKHPLHVLTVNPS